MATDLSGQRFGRLMALDRGEDYVSPCGKETQRWHCVCDCGTAKLVRRSSLLSGCSTSCGCYAKELAAEQGRAMKTHGHGRLRKRSPTYMTWDGMKQRCLNPNNVAWKYYGGRGISIDPRWLGKTGLATFIEDMGERPEHTTIDRVDPDGNYEKSNCRWSDSTTQRMNQRRMALTDTP